MAVALDHMSIPARDKVATAQFYARVFGVTYDGPRRHFAPVRLSDGLTLNFEESTVPEVHHYAFRATPEEFEAVLGRLKGNAIPFGSTTTESNGEVYCREGLRGFYFEDPNGHGLELIAPV